MNVFQEIYEKLMQLHGPQGWWPLNSNYHPGDYHFPRNSEESFEICVGAILTQNTAWTNVEKALSVLRTEGALCARAIQNIPLEKLASLIKSSGAFNQKAKKLKTFTDYFVKTQDKGHWPQRQELLNLWGIGPETADSICLYAFGQKEFVIDNYTKRIFTHLKLFTEKDDYDSMKSRFEKELPHDKRIFQEYHALIVEHAKKYYSRKDGTTNCPIFKEIYRKEELL